MTEGMTPADIAAVTGNNGNGFFGGDGAWFLIILFLFAFAGWGNGGFGGYGGASGAANNYVLSSDFATLQRQLSDGFGSMERKGDSIANGLCDGFYTNAQLINGVNTNIMQSANTIQSQLAQCCCDNKAAIADVKYTIATTGNNLQNAVQSGFCNTNFNMSNSTRDIVDNANANTRAILDAIQANKVEALKDRIAEQAQMISGLQLAASQSAQNSHLIDKLSPPTPIPAFRVNPPYAYNNCCNC